MQNTSSCNKMAVLLTLLSLSSLTLFALFSFPFFLKDSETSVLESSEHEIHHFQRLQQQQLQIAHTTCQDTLYPDLCVSSVSTLPDLHEKSLPEIISHIVNSTIEEVKASATNCSGIRKKLRNLDPIDRRALQDCLELLSDTVVELRTAVSDLSSTKSSSQHYKDLQTLFSAAMTNQYTCLDGFAYGKKNIRRYIEKKLRKISRHVSNSLAMLKKINKKKKKKKSPPSTSSGPEMFPEYGAMKNGFPEWLKKKDRALLQADHTNVSATNFIRNVTVAKDGSGNFTTINEALQAAPNNSDTRFVIYIKAGAYYEYIEVERKKKMIMFVGDGIGKTLIKGNRSVVDGWTTFRSATVGKFIFQSCTFLFFIFHYYYYYCISRSRSLP